MSTGKLIVLSAPSGTGKTSICKKLLEKNSKWQFSISATTRELREDESDGKDYIQMSNEKFDHFVKFGDFLEWEWVHGNKYGTLVEELEDVIDGDEVMLLDIDVKGGCNIMEEYPDNTFSIFIEPPGFDIPEKKLVLEERLLKRGNEQTTQIKNRLKRFEKEMEFIDRFNSSFVNDDLKEAIVEVEKAIKEKI